MADSCTWLFSKMQFSLNNHFHSSPPPPPPRRSLFCVVRGRFPWHRRFRDIVCVRGLLHRKLHERFFVHWSLVEFKNGHATNFPYFNGFILYSLSTHFRCCLCRVKKIVTESKKLVRESKKLVRESKKLVIESKN